MRMSISKLIVVWILAALASVPAIGDEAQQKPWLLHLNGIGGERSIDRMLLRGLAAGGFDAEMQIFDWTDGRDALISLSNIEHNRKQAAIVSEMILKQYRAEPGRPIILSGHSGGTGLGAWALEMLPEDVRVDTWLMLAPALSPEYDLTKALKHVKGKLHVFSSPNDTIVLSAGTKLFGTIDRIKCDAAGLNGFIVPEQGDLEQYRKLVPHPYQRAWFTRYGSAGTHICPLMPKFSREYVAILLKTGVGPGHAQAAAPTPTTRPVANLKATLTP